MTLEPSKNLKPILSNRLPGQLKTHHLPLTSQGGTKLHQWVEVIPEFDEKFDKAHVEELLMQSRYSDLPAPFNLTGKLFVPHTISFFLIHHDADKLATADGKKLLVKLVTLDGDAKLPKEDIKRLAHGIVYKVDYGKSFRNGSKAFHLMLLKLGGWQARYNHLVPSGGPKASKDREACNVGFKFIQRPRSGCVQIFATSKQSLQR